jgi:hypothetical protein
MAEKDLVITCTYELAIKKNHNGKDNLPSRDGKKI